MPAINQARTGLYAGHVQSVHAVPAICQDTAGCVPGYMLHMCMERVLMRHLLYTSCGPSVRAAPTFQLGTDPAFI